MSTLKDRLQSVLGCEDLDTVVEVIPVEEQAVVLADNDIAVAETVVAEHESEITELQHDIDVIEERLEDIEENVEGLESMMSGETEWNPALAMKMYNDARRLTERNFGPSEHIANVDGLESFADATTAQLTIIDGLEDVKEKSGSALTAIANFFKNLYKSIIAAFVGLFDRLKGIEKRSDALISRLNSTPDDKIKKKITLGPWNAYIGVEGSSPAMSKIGAVVNIVKETGAALNANKGGAALAVVDNVLGKFGSLVSNKKTLQGDASVNKYSGTIGGIQFNWTVPKTTEALKSASLTYKAGEGAKTSGDYDSGMNKMGLIALAKNIKGHAASARVDNFSASKLSTVRDKAIAAVKAAVGTGDTRKDAQAVRATHTVSNTIARTLTRYEGDVLVAGQKLITAHL